MKSQKDTPYKDVITQLIVDIFEKSNNQPLNYKQVAAKLNLTDPESKKAISDILSNASKKGLFDQTDRGKFKLKQRQVFITGKVDMTADGSAYIVPEDELENDIFIGLLYAVGGLYFRFEHHKL